MVTDRPDVLSQRTGPLRRFLGAAPSAAVVAVVGPDGAPPAMCRSVLEVGSLGTGRWWADASVDAHPSAVHAAGVTVAMATRVARSLAALVDPEEATGSGPVLGTTTGLAALTARHGPAPIDDPIAIAAAWRAAGPDPAPVATLGATADGVVAVDLVRDGPHALVAGTTGFRQERVAAHARRGLAAACSPDHVTFVLVDYKGGATFDACADLPHTVGVVTDLDDELAARALTSLEAEVRRREQVLRAVGVGDLAEHRARGGDPLPRLVVVVDEFAAWPPSSPTSSTLVGVAQRGRSLGIHLVLATQRPAASSATTSGRTRTCASPCGCATGRRARWSGTTADIVPRRARLAMLGSDPDEHVVFQAAAPAAAVLPHRVGRRPPPRRRGRAGGRWAAGARGRAPRSCVGSATTLLLSGCCRPALPLRLLLIARPRRG